MKIVADEGIDGQIVDILRGAGFSVHYFAEEAPGSVDQEVLSLAEMAGAFTVISPGLLRIRPFGSPSG